MPALNILVVMPRFISGKGEEYIFPLGIPYVSSALKSCDFLVHTVNLNHWKSHYTVLENIIREEHIDVIVSGGLSTEFPPVKKMFEVAKGCKSNIITICGGGMISGDPDATMEALACVDYGVIGEGEVTVCELCHCLESNTPAEQVKGIIFASNGQWVTTPPRKAIRDIDSIALPDYEGFDLEFYLKEYTSTLMDIDGVSRALSVLCSRSCPSINVSSVSDADMKDLANTIPILDAEKSGSVEFFDIKPGVESGAADFRWECPECGCKNSSSNSKLFALSFAFCSNCAFKTLPPVPCKTVSCIDSQMKSILKNSKIALWGMADYALDFLNKSNIVVNEDAYLIDIPEFK